MDLFLRNASRRATGRSNLSGESGKELVGWSRDAVEPAEQYDLAIEVVGLDVARPPSQALPRGGSRAPFFTDRPNVQKFADASRHFPGGGVVHAGCSETVFALSNQKCLKSALSRGRPAYSLYNIRKIGEELRALPTHDVRLRIRAKR
jgi:hypothetical protein